MRSPAASIHKARGFTLIEVLIVIGMLAIVGGMGLVVSMDSFRNYSLKDERDVVVSALQKARSQSINNMCFGPGCTDGKAHGVKILAGQYVIFQGASYATRNVALDEVQSSVYAAATATGLNEVVFAPLSGNATTLPAGTWTLTVADGAGNSVITIGAEGQIRWTH